METGHERRLAVCAADPACREQARELAAHLEVPFYEDAQRLSAEEKDAKEAGNRQKQKARAVEDRGEKADPVVLVMDREGLSLCGDGMRLRGDFTGLLPRIRRENLFREPLVKAARIKGEKKERTAVDATAGLGEDAFLLAAAGWRITMFEKDPVIAALLRDALDRAERDSALAPVVSRLSLREEDSLPYLRSIRADGKERPDLILLDPMFPGRTKSGLVRKKFQLLHLLERPCGNEEELLMGAVKANPLKIVVKRPAKGPYLAGRKADYSLEGSRIRYDCYISKGVDV